MSSKSESTEKEANKTSKKAAKVMKGRMQEDNSQSGSSYSIFGLLFAKFPKPEIVITLYHARDMLV